MLTVDRLRLQLPPAFRDRAGEIARLVGEELASVSVGADLEIDRLAVPPIEVHPQATNREVARAIAQSVGTELEKTSSPL
ncbi:hypothetical protein [Geobacter benzoatilyticus]|jgi:Glu-tRNA(Gln) amidotransferase subunit E-like FAD-binding protein|uniref:Uncharacterized protein n=1 Tax=Geobacter benzoatilyticus TaxID=2815309 RepID=A0ABX7Q2V5_9BACT|nr:hypothetical protein [Geobacter benzoatilyticus]QSV45778.1 hypothetical protein JZM60_00320 [Geobacter benzoatilyticus]